MRSHVLDERVKSEILNICREVASPQRIVAASIHDSEIPRLARRKGVVNVLLVLSSPRLTLRYSVKPIKDKAAALLAVDHRTFEKDVDRDWLGGLLVESMLVPYEPLINQDYLWDQEVKAKKRILVEILSNLVLEYPEMSHEILIKPEFFMFETMARKAALYPPMAYRFLNILGSDSREANKELMMKGFEAALQAVAEEGLIEFSNGYVKITKKCTDTIQRKKLRVISLLKIVRNSILRHSLEVFPKMMRSLVEDYWSYTKSFIDPGDFRRIHLPELQDPKGSIFIPTLSGLVSLSGKTTVEDFVKRTVPNGQSLEVETEKLSGVLNTVYTLRLARGEEEQKIVVKVFKDWYGWKWFPLALWALGTRGFAVLGKSRLEREYAINRFLSSQGINVPKIIHVSPKERLIFQEFVEGENLVAVIKQICSSREERDDLAALVRQAGREVAKIHGLGVAVGDCKPENIIVAPDERLWFVDLEQAERSGDQAWDIAELLYFSGHYALLSPSRAVQTIAREFIEGYLEAGGKAENIKKARSPRYAKVFSFFTPPHLLLAISNVCGAELKSKKWKERRRNNGRLKCPD